jgi:hypothetical protein
MRYGSPRSKLGGGNIKRATLPEWQGGPSKASLERVTARRVPLTSYHSLFLTRDFSSPGSCRRPGYWPRTSAAACRTFIRGPPRPSPSHAALWPPPNGAPSYINDNNQVWQRRQQAHHVRAPRRRGGVEARRRRGERRVQASRSPSLAWRYCRSQVGHRAASSARVRRTPQQQTQPAWQAGTPMTRA